MKPVSQLWIIAAIIGILEIVAIEHGFNGVMFKTAVGAISGIALSLIYHIYKDKKNQTRGSDVRG